MTKIGDRWRCLTVGCNPKLYGEEQADRHRESEGHRVAKWPVRSPEGQRRARIRNKSGYYDRYNIGPKSREARFGSLGGNDDHPFSSEALGQD